MTGQISLVVMIGSILSVAVPVAVAPANHPAARESEDTRNQQTRSNAIVWIHLCAPDRRFIQCGIAAGLTMRSGFSVSVGETPNCSSRTQKVNSSPTRRSSTFFSTPSIVIRPPV